MTTQTIPQARRLLGEKAFAATLQAARKNCSMTKTEAMTLARSLKRKNNSLKVTADTIYECVEFLKTARCRKHNYPYSPRRSLQPRAVLPEGRPIDRLPEYRQKLWLRATAPLKNALDHAIGYVAHSEPTVIKSLAPDAPLSAITVGVAIRDLGRYSRGCTWRKIARQIVAKVPANWAETVDAKQLTYIHGLPTLAAQPVENEREGEEIFRATWARKTQGCNFLVESGYIVRRDGEIAHGKTLSGARAVLTRRETEKQLDRIEAEIYRRIDAGQYNGAGDKLVTIGDSLRAGNCEAGTLAFRDKHFPGRESATVREVMTAASTFGDRRFAIAACIKALQRQNYHSELS